MEWIDLTLPIDDSYPSWPACPGFRLVSLTRISDGEPANNTCFEMYSHFGTHIDAPKHFVGDGISVDAIPLDTLIGPCRVYEIANNDTIRKPDLQSLNFDSIKRVLFKTANSNRIHDRIFHSDYVGLDLGATEFLLSKGVEVVGTDYYSAAKYTEAAEVHRLWLGAGNIFLEGLDLSNVAPGCYQLVALPIKMADAEAAPARIILGKCTAEHEEE